MKKDFLILFLILFIALISCKRQDSKESKNEVSEKSIFSPALKREILKMIEVKNVKVNEGGIKPKVCNVIILQDNENEGICIVIITLGMNIVQNVTKFTPPSSSSETQIDSSLGVIGYTFLDNELIGCWLLSTSCNNMLIDKKRLKPVKDSIPGYPNVLNIDSDLIYDAPMRMFRIINSDSLQLIKSAFISQE